MTIFKLLQENFFCFPFHAVTSKYTYRSSSLSKIRYKYSHQFSKLLANGVEISNIKTVKSVCPQKGHCEK